jgi:S-sulfosulfanyl-L-cysteine sulfohydrolase
MKKISSLFLMGLLFSGCNMSDQGLTLGDSDDNATPVEDNISSQSESVQIRLIHFNDLHAHLTQHKDRVIKNGKAVVEMRGGIARIATEVERLKSESENSILMNIGDTFHGGVEATFTNGNAIVDAVNAIGVDIGVMGNWDFAYGPGVSKLRFTDKSVNVLMKKMAGDVKAVNYPVLAANWFESSTFGSSDEPMLPATKIMIKEGVKIGFIGLTSDIVERMHAGFAFGSEFTQGEEAYVNLVNTHTQALRQAGCQVVVVMSELGIHKDKALADLVNQGVDVFFSAHTHEVTPTPLTSKSGALVVEAGNDGYLGVMDLNVNKSGVQKADWKLVDIDSSITPKAEIVEIVNRERAPFLSNDINMEMPSMLSGLTLEKSIDTVVGYSQVSLDRRHLFNSTFNTAMTDALLDASGSELALTPGFRFDSIIENEANPLLDAQITIEDLYRLFPSPFTLSTAKISGSDFKSIYEQMMHVVVSKDAFETNGGWIEGVGGVSATIDLQGENSHRIKDIRLKSDNSVIEDDRLYSITGCSRPLDSSDVLCSYSGFEDKEEFINPTTSSQYNVINFLESYIASGKFGVEHHHDIVDESDLQMWPSAQFIQPIMK